MTPDTLRIPLRNRKKRIVAYALIDTEDWLKITDADDWLRTDKSGWYLHKTGYAARNTKKYKGKRRQTIYLQRAVMNVDRYESRIVDHINGILLDCRKKNLRLITQSLNGFGRAQKIIGNGEPLID